MITSHHALRRSSLVHCRFSRFVSIRLLFLSLPNQSCLLLLCAVVPVLFEHSLRKPTGDAVVTVAQVLGMEPAAARIRNPATDSEVALALRVLQGCCLLCPACAAAAHRYNAVKVRPRRDRRSSLSAFRFPSVPSCWEILHHRRCSDIALSKAHQVLYC